MAYAYTKRRFFFVYILFSFLCIWGCGVKNPIFVSEDFPRKNLIAEIKQFEKKIGYTKDINFHSYDPSDEAIYVCYSTGKFILPRHYSDASMNMDMGKEAGCRIDAKEHDVFFYASQAFSGGFGLQKSLANEKSLERFIMAIFHEDYHEETPPVPPDVGESATTMMGFAVAIDFARERYGEDSLIYKNLLGEPDLCLQSSRIVNRFYEEIKALYGRFHRGEVREPFVVWEKKRLFNALEKECNAIRPWPKTVSPCPPALNNAGLGFDITYTRHFPRMYDMWVRSGKNAKALFDSFKKDLK